MSVVLLSGFLGAGKTTVLEQVLKEKHGFRLGVVVNDLASVNVDANVLKKAIDESGTVSISLENGCVCCTAADDLRQSVDKLVAAQPGLDAVVVEMSGVAEPARVRQSLETQGYNTWWKRNRAVSVRTITVVDSPAFSADYLKEKSSHEEHSHTADGECDTRYGALLAEQVEHADMILLNKADIATETELQQTQAVIQALNGIADTRVTTYGKVKVNELLGAEAKEPLAVEPAAAPVEIAAAQPEKVSACCAAKTCSKTNKASADDCSEEVERNEAKSRAETRFGITSFVYSTERVMSREKLLQQIESWQQSRASLGDRLNLEGLSTSGSAGEARAGAAASVQSPLLPVLRSKGILLLDAAPDTAYYWSHAGKAVNFSIFGQWPPNIPQDQGGFGAPRTELVFIGARYDEGSIRSLLDSCLLTDAELSQLGSQPGAQASQA